MPEQQCPSKRESFTKTPRSREGHEVRPGPVVQRSDAVHCPAIGESTQKGRNAALVEDREPFEELRELPSSEATFSILQTMISTSYLWLDTTLPTFPGFVDALLYGRDLCPRGRKQGRAYSRSCQLGILQGAGTLRGLPQARG